MVEPLRFGIIGLGSIGASVAQLARSESLLALVGVSARDQARARARLEELGVEAPVLPLPDLIERSEILVEALPPAAFRSAVEPALQAGRSVMVLSSASLLANWDLVAIAEGRGARLILPSGAILALDAVRAAALGDAISVTIRSSKPPRGFASTPYVVENGIDVMSATKPLQLFAGSVRDGAAAFPTSVNVAVAAALAGIGPDRTRLEVWADPGVTRNVHEVMVTSSAADFTARIENIPSPNNPRTSSIVGQSVVAALLNRRAVVQFA